MSKLVSVRVLLTLFFACAAMGATSPIDPYYESIHRHVYSDLGVKPPATDRSEAERYAFVRTYCDRNPGVTACDGIDDLEAGPIVLAFNHDSQSWRVVYGLDPRDLEINNDGDAKVLGIGGRVVVAVVESTNPLLYAVEAGPIAETPPEIVAKLQAFLEKLGPGIVSAVAFGATGPTAEQTAAVKAVEDAVKPLECVAKQWLAAQRFAERAETRRGGDYQLVAVQCGIADEEALDAAIEKADVAAKALAKIEFCNDNVIALKTLLLMPPNDVAALKEAHEKIQFSTACDTSLVTFGNAIGSRIQRLEAGAFTPQRWREFAQADINALNARIEKAEKAKQLIDAVTALKTDEKRTELAGVLRDIQKFESRLLRNVVTTDKKDPKQPRIKVGEVADFLVVRKGEIVVGDNNRVRKLDVKKDSPFQNTNFTRAEVSTNYGTGSLFLSLTDLNMSLTHTSLADPEFGTVTEKAPTTEDPNATKLVIAKKGEDSRSAQLALIASLPVFYRVQQPWARRVGLDIGVGASTDTTALFLGASWKLTRAIRLGFGKTWQQVTALDGQKIGETVLAADNVKTKEELDSSWYASFSFSLGSLKLFKDE